MTSFSKTLLAFAAMVLATMCHGADKIEFGNITNSTEMYTAKAVDELIGEADNITSNDVLSITESATNALVNALTSEDAPLVVQESLESSHANVATYANSAEVAYGLGTEEGIPASRTTESIFNQLDAATTTNDVCNIVTNETLEGWGTSWTYTPKSISYEGRTLYPTPLGPSWRGDIWMLLVDDDDENPFMLQADPEVYGEDASMIVFSGIPGTLTAIRTPITRNALGLARLIDLPPLTNGLPNVYQAKLPYDTNSIPVSAVSNALSVTEAEAGFTKWTLTSQVSGFNSEEWTIEWVTNGVITPCWALINVTDHSYDTIQVDMTNAYATKLVITDWPLGGWPPSESTALFAMRTRLPTWSDISDVSTQLDGKVAYSALTNEVCAIVTNTSESVPWTSPFGNLTWIAEGEWYRGNLYLPVGGYTTTYLTYSNSIWKLKNMFTGSSGIITNGGWLDTTLTFALTGDMELAFETNKMVFNWSQSASLKEVS